MKATETTFSKILQIEGTLEHYHIPKYQREYTWRYDNWEQLLLDIDENPPGYFMGSIIGVNEGDEIRPGQERIFELVDGQQRLTTLSILMMAIYKKILEQENQIGNNDPEELDKFRNTLSSIRIKLIKKKKEFYHDEIGGHLEDGKIYFLRVQPSTQNHNLEDYIYILNQLGLVKYPTKPPYHSKRLINKAYQYFIGHIPTEISKLYEFFDKINQITFIHIAVSSQADAFTLFETLNNRGVPLSAIDIIKNKMLSELDKQHNIDVDISYEDWQKILKNLPDENYHERFLRHYYNAFNTSTNIKVEGYPKATKSTLIGIYENLIRRNAKYIFDELLDKSEIYNQFLEPEKISDNALSIELTELKRIGAAPSYQLLLYLFSLRGMNAFDETDLLLNTIKLLQKYYIRRNITDFPSTRDLDTINLEIIDKCQNSFNSIGQIKYNLITESLLTGKGKPSPLDIFKGDLEDNLYYYNAGMARYLLAKIDSISHTREYKPDLWARNDKDHFVWTVEHILPQSQNLPQCWVDMVGGGDMKKAIDVHENYVHCLGNLTLSGYNSSLSNSCFPEKQSKHENKTFLGYKINIGYKNGLALNNLNFVYDGKETNLSNIHEWTKDSIITRNNRMVEILLDLYRFDYE